MKEKENIYSLRGGSKVYGFTLGQTLKNKSYILTFCIFVLMITFMGPLQYFMASSGANTASSFSKNDFSETKIEKLYVTNTTPNKLTQEDLQKDNDSLKCQEWIYSELAVEVPKLGANDVMVILSIDDTAIHANAIIADNSSIKISEANDIAEQFKSTLKTCILNQSSISEKDTKMIQNGVSTNGIKTEQEYKESLNTDNKMADGKFSMMLVEFSIIILMISSLSATYILNSVTEEKVSKLTETLLVSVRPMALLFGKILAMMTFIIGTLLIGLLGSKITDYVMYNVLNWQRVANDASFGFADLFNSSVTGLVFILISVLLGYLFFGVLSGLMGSTCSKTEDIQDATGLITVIGMVCYFGVIFLGNREDVLSTVCFMVPPLSFFSLPVAYIGGRVSFGMACVSYVFQIVAVFLMLLLATKTYRKLIMNDSTKPSFKTLLAALGKGAK